MLFVIGICDLFSLGVGKREQVLSKRVDGKAVLDARRGGKRGEPGWIRETGSQRFDDRVDNWLVEEQSIDPVLYDFAATS